MCARRAGPRTWMSMTESPSEFTATEEWLPLKKLLRVSSEDWPEPCSLATCDWCWATCARPRAHKPRSLCVRVSRVAHEVCAYKCLHGMSAPWVLAQYGDYYQYLNTLALFDLLK